MEDSVCLDSDVLIDFLRNKKEAVEWVKENESSKNLATTIINVFELYAGVYKSKNQQNNLAVLDSLIERLKILPFSLKSAQEAARQNASLEKKGQIIDKRDLFIGSIALTEGASLKTNNKKHFSRIERLKIENQNN